MSSIKRTQFAQAAFDFAGYFTATFSSLQVAGSAVRRPVLVAPQEMSTAGGRKAKQHIVLQADGGAVNAVTVGWIDLSVGQTCLRTYGCLQQMHAQRFGARPFDLDPQSYQAFFDRACQFFSSQGMRVQIETQSELAATAPKAASGSKNLILVIVVVLALFAIVAIAGLGWVYIHYFR